MMSSNVIDISRHDMSLFKYNMELISIGGITMNFSDKLNYLLNLYKINNAKLARAINVDPSLISRWKSGIRVPPQNSNYLTDIAKYFLTLTTSTYQTEKLNELLKIDLPQGQAGSIPHLIQVLSDWLVTESDLNKLDTASSKYSPTPENAVNIINNISKIVALTGSSKDSSLHVKPQVEDICFFPGQIRKHELFKGREGKRQAVLNFLNTVLASPKPLELLLTSSEDVRWMTEDKEFLQTWAKTLKTIIDLGHSITIIHVVNRDTSEIMSILNYWMPLHLTGRLKSYYHPKYVENKLKSSYFIIRDVASIVSFSSDGYERNDATLFFNDPFETKIFEENILTYLSECKPLMNIYTENNVSDYYKQLIYLEESTGVSYKTNNQLFGLFMSKELTQKLLEGIENKETHLSVLYRRTEVFQVNLSRYKHIFVLPIELLDRIVFNREYIFPGIEILQKEDVKIKGIDLILYFENLIKYLKEYENLEIYLSGNVGETRINKVSISYKENNTSSFTTYLPDGSPIAVVLNEANILNSLELYFEDYFYKIPSSYKKKDMIIEKLNKVISSLKDTE